MSRISAYEHSILCVFSDEYAFCIPNYQRPYRWGRDQAEQLLKDVNDSTQEAKPFLQKRVRLITNEILKQDQWTPAVFTERQQRFEKALKTAWRLDAK